MAEWALIFVALALSLYNVLLCLHLDQRARELKAFEERWKEILFKVRANVIARKRK